LAIEALPYALAVVTFGGLLQPPVPVPVAAWLQRLPSAHLQLTSTLSVLKAGSHVA
jgi:hypothetical protein